MGKKSKYPEYSSGSITVNGNTVATTKRDKNNNIVDSNYNMSKMKKIFMTKFKAVFIQT